MNSTATCPVCGTEFSRATIIHTFCSKRCANRAYRTGQSAKMVTDAFEPREFRCRCCGALVVVTEPIDRRTVYCCAACERKYWRDRTRHQSRSANRITNYHSTGDYFSYERATNERWVGA